jgi:6-phosphofructokinase 1
MMDASDRGMSEVVDARFMSDSQQSLPTLVPLLREGEQPRLVAFPAGESGSVLHCRSLRDQLHPRPSPFIADNYRGGGFVSDDDRINLQAVHFASAMSAGARSQGRLDELAQQTGCSVSALPPCTLRAGPRETIYFEPATTQMAIVTCGELCPGLNDVIRGIVLKALDYGVPEGNILGIRHGLCGFYDKHHKPLVLSRSIVDDIHLEGGTMLGTCKEPADLNEVVKRLDLWKIDMLFVIGGPGSHTGAVAIQEQCSRSNVLTTVIAVPKSIDNDILLVDKTFGFETAVEEAQKALLAAQVEATSGYRGVGTLLILHRFTVLCTRLLSG